MQFISETGTNKFTLEDCTIILPTLATGNVGQLAVDLMISTFNIPRIGYLETPYAVPVVGNDAFTANKGTLCINMEVYGTKNVVFVQQRGPVIKGKYNIFSEELVQWIKQAKFKEMILLHSSEITKQTVVPQRSGPHFRYFKYGKDSNDTHLNSLNWVALESQHIYEAIYKGSVTDKILSASKKESVSLLAMILFCSEGNNIPEGTHMAQLLDQYLGSLLKPDGQTEAWKAPVSWSLLFSGGSFDQNLFM